MSKINSEKHFHNFYYSSNNISNKDKDNIIFEYEGKQYKFFNIHEEKYEKDEKSVFSNENRKLSSNLDKLDKRFHNQQTSLISTNIPNSNNLKISEKPSTGEDHSKILSVKGEIRLELSMSHRKMNL